MPDLETLSERVSTLEQTLTDGEMPALEDDAELRRTTADLAARMDELETELDELDAAVQALRGYVGNIRAVNDDVERRVDAALAKAEACQSDPSERSFESGRNRTASRSNRAVSERRFGTDSEGGSKIGRQHSSDDSGGSSRSNPPSPYEIPRTDGDRTESGDRSLTARLRELL
ncbi:hypothetical protein V5735_06055 (plasmid) [Haladaptatus sp. SPP-AMP-3]|uniref:DUF7310 family coiled-coil domain-containing protein n=1 Tax=Haladaptatus sp. SPP-AMP-3 TaxID=3121295 RepID=UPI003C2B849D